MEAFGESNLLPVNTCLDLFLLLVPTLEHFDFFVALGLGTDENKELVMAKYFHRRHISFQLSLYQLPTIFHVRYVMWGFNF